MLFHLRSLTEAVGLSNKLKNVTLMREPVKESRRHCLVPKNRIPIRETEIGCDNNGDSFIEIGAEDEWSQARLSNQLN